MLLRTSLLGLRLEKTLRGHCRCRCPEHQLRMLSHSTVLEGPGPSSRCSRTSCFRARTAVFSSICSSWGGEEEEEERSQGKIETHTGGLQVPPGPRWSPLVTHLPQGGLLVSQPYDEDAVGLADAALGPGRHAAVRLVEDDAVDVLLLGQPARETVLMDAEEEEEEEENNNNNNNNDGTGCCLPVCLKDCESPVQS